MLMTNVFLREKTLPIGIFDSGVGGLSILREVQKLLPNESFIFIADQKNVPYGEKTEEELNEIVSRIVKYFLKKKVKMIVIACNTATVYTIENIRSKYAIPIAGTVPAIKVLSKVTKTGKVGILATPATSKSLYLAQLCKIHAPNLEIFKVGATHLEEMIEDGNLERNEINDNLEYHIRKLINFGVDAISLGCTHYPFLRDKIEKITGPGVAIVDSGFAVSKQVKKVLEEKDLLSELKNQEDIYYTTGNEKRFRRVAEELLGKKIKHVKKIKI
jgi:glutamate racemase